MTMFAKKLIFGLIFLGVIQPLFAQEKSKNDTSFIKPTFKNYVTTSLAVGTRSFFYKDLDKLDGTNKQLLTDINWIPISLKYEYSDIRWVGIGLTLNNINHQKIYDAAWLNYKTGKTEVHHFTHIDRRLSFLVRVNLFFFKNDFIESYVGGGFGFAKYEHEKTVIPDSYEYDGSGELRFLQILGLETSVGFRIYPFKNKQWGFMVEAGMMQSRLQLGLAYRLMEAK